MKTWLSPSLVLFFVSLAAACGPASGTEGADCPNNNNCISPLRCVEGTCQVSDAPLGDAGVRDGGVVRDGGPNGPRDGGVIVYEDKFSSGTVTVTPDGTTGGFQALAGRAGMVREATGYTSVRVVVTGLTPNTMFGSHVHALPCDQEAGGGHYQIDDTVVDVMQQNEIWPSINVGADGSGSGSIRVNHYARMEAQSIVIHEPVERKRIGCIDLALNADVTASGSFIELAAGNGSGITGTATLRRYGNQTAAMVMLSGAMPPNANYGAHVHDKRCDDMEGGGHYKIDTGIQDVDADNEIWPVTTVNAAGDMAMGQRTVMHLARFDAYSVVIHDATTRDRLLCADLEWEIP